MNIILELEIPDSTIHVYQDIFSSVTRLSKRVSSHRHPDEAANMPALPTSYRSLLARLGRPVVALPPSMGKMIRSLPSDSSGPRRTWIIIGAVGAVLVLSTIVAVASLALLRRRRQRRQALRRELTRHPHMTRGNFVRWRKMSDLEREEEEERQRAIIIRKSLASRSSSWSGGGGNSSTNSFRQGSAGGAGTGNGSIRSLRSMCNSTGNFSLMDRTNSSVSALTIEEETEEEADSDERRGGRRGERRRTRSVSTGDGPRRPMRLRDEWKELERGLLRQRTVSGEIHPVEVALPIVPPPASPRKFGRMTAMVGPPMPSPTLPLLPRVEQESPQICMETAA